MSLRNTSIRYFSASIACLAFLAMGPRASADPIMLYSPSYNYDYVSASAYDGNVNGSTTQNSVNSLPFLTPTGAIYGTSSSSVTSTLTTSMLSFGFAQSVVDPYSGDLSASSIQFTVGANTTYSIAGTLTATGDFTSESLHAILTNLNPGNYGATIYGYDNTSSGGTQTLDSSGGPLTGILGPGLYQFSAYDYLDAYYRGPDNGGGIAGLTGNTAITFSQPSSVVPEPTSFLLLGVGGSLPLIFQPRHRRKFARMARA